MTSAEGAAAGVENCRSDISCFLKLMTFGMDDEVPLGYCIHLKPQDQNNHKTCKGIKMLFMQRTQALLQVIFLLY